jgi:hypothetical protein
VTLAASASSPAYAAIGTPNSAVGVIGNAGPVMVTVVRTTTGRVQEGSIMGFTAMLSSSVDVPVTFDVTVDLPAVESSFSASCADFTGGCAVSLTKSLTIAAGATSVAFSYPIAVDALTTEFAERVSIMGSNLQAQGRDVSLTLPYLGSGIIDGLDSPLFMYIDYSKTNNQNGFEGNEVDDFLIPIAFATPDGTNGASNEFATTFTYNIVLGLNSFSAKAADFSIDTTLDYTVTIPAFTPFVNLVIGIANDGVGGDSPFEEFTIQISNVVTQYSNLLALVTTATAFIVDGSGVTAGGNPGGNLVGANGIIGGGGGGTTPIVPVVPVTPGDLPVAGFNGALTQANGDWQVGFTQAAGVTTTYQLQVSSSTFSGSGCSFLAGRISDVTCTLVDNGVVAVAVTTKPYADTTFPHLGGNFDVCLGSVPAALGNNDCFTVTVPIAPSDFPTISDQAVLLSLVAPTTFSILIPTGSNVLTNVFVFPAPPTVTIGAVDGANTSLDITVNAPGTYAVALNVCTDTTAVSCLPSADAGFTLTVF